MEPNERLEKCNEISSLLSEYLNLELPPDACEEIQAHVAGCSACIEFTESLHKTVDICRLYRPSTVPEPLGTDAREQLLDAYQKNACRPQVSPLRMADFQAQPAVATS
jgi:hypothetical protein